MARSSNTTPRTDWRALVAYGAAVDDSAPARGRTSKDKLLAAFDKQVELFNTDLYETAMARRKAWFKPVGDRLNISLRLGAMAIKLHTEGAEDQHSVINTARRDAKAVLKGIRQGIVAGEYDDFITDAENDAAAKRAARKAA